MFDATSFSIRGGPSIVVLVVVYEVGLHPSIAADVRSVENTVERVLIVAYNSRMIFYSYHVQNILRSLTHEIVPTCPLDDVNSLAL